LNFPKSHIVTGIILLYSFCYSTDYHISILGIPVVEIEMIEHPADSITYITTTTGVFDYIWSTQNSYGTKFLPHSYTMEQYTKVINQTDRHGQISIEYNEKQRELYINDASIKVNEAPQNIFTMLTQIRKKDYREMDAEWFPLFHEGDWYRSRFLFIDTVSVEVNGNQLLCDHYRFDIEKSKELHIKILPADYFSDHIASPEAVRQIWVQNSGENRQIIKAQVSVYGITLTAMIQNHHFTASK
jgi:hypothetical protein